MTRGGKRPGSGRPRGDTHWITRSVSLDTDHVRMLAELAHFGACSESEVVRAAITLVYLSRATEDKQSAEPEPP